MASPLDNIAIVLFKPQSAGNAGAAARVMKNLGLRDLRIVAPKFRHRTEAVTMAVHAEDVLGAATEHPTLADALADRTVVAGTTARSRSYRSRTKSLRIAAPEIASDAHRERIAVVFGPEDHGLTNAEIKLCHRLVTIETGDEYPSLNLAQSVAIVAYAIANAIESGREADVSAAPQRAPATEVAAMLERMSDTLVAIGFSAEENPDHIMYAIRAMLGRAGVSAHELDILNGLARQMRWVADGGAEVLAAKRRAGKRLR
jgi:tRNA/rRNA methyltransferase